MPDARFIALPVKGDAFYLRRGGAEILFDGGGTNLGDPEVPEGLEACMIQDELDIAVCSHNDSDHAKGIIAVVSESLAEKVWLPANWLHRLPSVMEEPECFLFELANDIEVLVEEQEEVVVDDDSSFRIFEEIEEDGQNIEIGEVNPSEAIEDMSNRYPRRPIDIDWEWVKEVGWWFPGSILSLSLSRNRSRAFKTTFRAAIEKFANIRDIIAAAVQNSVDIEWFEYRDDRVGQGNSLLEPVNSTKVSQKFTIRSMSALHYLRLSSVNEESLVFWSPPDVGPGVLFCADSPLRFNSGIPTCDRMLITAPHHGAESNSQAYDRLSEVIEAKQVERPRWVRGDGTSNLGQWYRDLEEDKKWCVKCDRGTREKVWFTANRHHWRKGHGRDTCSC